MNEARKQKYLNKDGFDETNPTSNGIIGATGDGIYGVNSMPPQTNGVGFGVDANGTYNVDINGNKTYDTQPNQSMYSGGNFNWSTAPKFNGMDVNQKLSSWGNPNQYTSFSGMGGGKESDHGMNITDQTIGQNYNNRIDGQVGGLNIPRSPQGGGSNLDKLLTTSGLGILTGKDGGTFSSVLNGFGGLLGGSGSNPYQPSNSLNNQAQSIEGQNNASANDLSRYLGDEYNRGRWIHQDYVDRGIDDPVISMLRYDTKIAPLVQRAREDRLKDLFMRSNNRNLSDEERMEAKLQLAGELQDPEFIDKMEYNNWKRQKEMDEWDLDRISKGIRNKAAQETLENNRILSDLASAFPDGQIYKVNMGSGYADEGLKNTNPELVQGLDILNTFVRNRFGKDLTVTGGARTKEHNASVNGDPNSHHLYGEAVDLVDSGLTPEQQEEVVKFAKAIGFTAAKYHDAGSGMHLHVALDKSSHLKGINIGKGKTLTVGQMLGQTTTKNKTNPKSKEQGATYDAQRLADLVNDTFTNGKTSGTNEEHNAIAKEMKMIIPALRPESPADAAEKLYEYYQNNGDKGWSLNSEAFSDIVGRAVYSYFNDLVADEDKGKIPTVQQLSKHVYTKYDPQVQKMLAEYEEMKKKNGGVVPSFEQVMENSLKGKSGIKTAAEENGYKGGGSFGYNSGMEDPWRLLQEKRNLGSVYDTGG